MPIADDLLPRKLSSLNDAGVKKLLEIAKSSPGLARLAAAQLESDPKGALDRLFRLSDAQRASIAATSDEELKQRVAAAVSMLRTGAFEVASVSFDPGGASAPGAAFAFAERQGSGGTAELKVKCDCHITIES